jgi:hypothetical protein
MLGYMNLGSAFDEGIAGQARTRAAANGAVLYDLARNKAWWGHIYSILTRRSRSLLSLDATREACTIRG